jgi:uncharacterized protein YjbJ (UPF0337 family)
LAAWVFRIPRDHRIHSRCSGCGPDFARAAFHARQFSKRLGHGGNTMKPSTEDRVEGKVHEVKGKIKKAVGKITNDPDLEGEGLGEKIAGKIQKKVGQLEKLIEKP